MRIGVILDTPVTPEPWAERLLERICKVPELALCVAIEPAVTCRRNHPLARAWHALEQAVAARPEPAHCPAYAALRDRLPIFALADRAEIAALGLDVILDLSTGGGRSCPPELARHGLWFVDAWRADPGQRGLRALVDRQPVIPMCLCAHMAGQAEPVVIATGTLNPKAAATRSDLFIREKAGVLIVRELMRVQRAGAIHRHDGPVPAEPAPVSGGDALHYAHRLSALALNRVAEGARARLRLRPEMFFLKTIGGDPLGFDPSAAIDHLPEGNAYYADPFLWDRDGQLHCFFEVYDYATHRGHIGVGRLVDGRLLDVRVALRTDYHLSFPFLFEDGGSLFMMPESCAARRIEIWRCVAFPDRWERQATALEGTAASDSTLTRIDGRWWLFTNISTDPFEEMNSELHLFMASGPGLETLVPHPLNPVVFDSRTARNGGRIFERHGIRYRPSQDNSHGTYGHGLNLMRIDRLTPDDYAETLVRRIEPDFEPGITGCHHLDVRSGTIVIDVRKRHGGWPGKGPRSRRPRR
ncbi:hypothetical protein SAMN06295912_12531 [Sphingomonas laterariae]|uniref:Glucosamine inositolphosphorylceramide transferase 1 N-terminal domain-containing protein n=1 Tax=Edaphosphingomonas laterariae TaxID=861865 RepID=A0A239ILT8_9SPHN|nr:hypothetical protein [Sphingomonas laterariae]SNS94168.1 hypothetical protein SAMN06295912_12531 [Sphingomonas laterariae]